MSALRTRSTDELLSAILTGSPSALELELAGRLEKAEDRIEELQAELDFLRYREELGENARRNEAPEHDPPLHAAALRS